MHIYKVYKIIGFLNVVLLVELSALSAILKLYHDFLYYKRVKTVKPCLG
jgi:hypothetical protein